MMTTKYYSKLDEEVLSAVDIDCLLAALKKHLSCGDLVLNHKNLNSNSIFCACIGHNVDARAFIPNALKMGVGCVLSDVNDTDTEVATEDRINAHGFYLDNIQNSDIFFIKNLNKYLGIIASHQYQDPSTKLNVIAVTGTNGKTSISHYLAQAYSFLNQVTGVIGTLGCGIYPHIKQLDSMTTPNAVVLNTLLNDFVAINASNVVMEASSHALDQGRLNGVCIKYAVFTNLTCDHLDYHLDMESYYQAKRKLFMWHGLHAAVININDPYGKRLVGELLDTDTKVITYGIDCGDLCVSDIVCTNHGYKFTLKYHAQDIHIESKLLGIFNIYNLMAVIGILILDGVTLDVIAKLIPTITSVSGRMEIVCSKPLVIVDFAHTPDALEKLLLTIHEMDIHKKIICVFGCGGNRDGSKRPIMGEIAARLATHVVITSDNPRNENQANIAKQIVAGIATDNYTVINNRDEAIQYALALADIDNSYEHIVVIAGKGHESYQEIDGIKIPFSDACVVKKYMNTHYN